MLLVAQVPHGEAKCFHHGFSRTASVAAKDDRMDPAGRDAEGSLPVLMGGALPHLPRVGESGPPKELKELL